MDKTQIQDFLNRLSGYLHTHRVIISGYAFSRATLEPGWDQSDILLQLGELTTHNIFSFHKENAHEF